MGPPGKQGREGLAGVSPTQRRRTVGLGTEEAPRTLRAVQLGGELSRGHCT